MSASESVLLGPSQPATAVNFTVPQGACDCLTHVYGPFEQFPMAPERTYTPELASIGELEALHRALHVDRVIIVQPTLYGTDNSCTLDAIQRIGSRARGIAVIDDHPSTALLDELDERGMRGIRVNLETIGQVDPEVARRRLQAALESVSRMSHWHVEMYARLPLLDSIFDLLATSPVPVVLDHFAGIKVERDAESHGLKMLDDLLQSGNVYAKLSAPYLASQQAPDFPDAVHLAQKLIHTNRQQILWGTNWPHPNSTRAPGSKTTDITPLRRVDDGCILNMLPLWAPAEADRKAILVDNPARLYGF